MKHRFKTLGFAFCLAAVAALAQDAAPEGAITRGRDVFEADCYDCHNADSEVFKTGPGFKGVKNGKLPSGAAATRENVLEILNEGYGEEMPPFADLLTDEEKEDVIAYVLSR